MLDKVFLFLFGLEWFGFGIMGLFFPEIIISLLGVYDYSIVFLNETRALYAFFTFVGLMSFIGIYRINLRKKVSSIFIPFNFEISSLYPLPFRKFVLGRSE